MSSNSEKSHLDKQNKDSDELKDSNKDKQNKDSDKLKDSNKNKQNKDSDEVKVNKRIFEFRDEISKCMDLDDKYRADAKKVTELRKDERKKKIKKIKQDMNKKIKIATDIILEQLKKEERKLLQKEQELKKKEIRHEIKCEYDE